MTRLSAERTPGAAPAAVDLTVRRAVVRFTVLSLVALLLLVVGTALVADRIAKHRALGVAREQAAGLADRLVAPLVDRTVRAHDPDATARLDTVMANRMRDGSVRHVKLWDEDGRIIWSDQPELIGRQFELEPAVAGLFGTQDATAEVSNLAEDENVAERGLGEEQLVEVYAGDFDADGEPFVFEAYLTTDRMEQDALVITRSFLPLVVGALALLLLIVLPLAISLTRRVVRAEQDRSRMMRHALLASDRERRRIAQDLHDGVIQDLAGVGYVLPTASRQLRPDGDLGHARTTLNRVVDLVQRDIASLRALMTDINPPHLDGPGLRVAVTQLVQSEALEANLESAVVIDPDLELSADAGQLAYRVVREGVRNVVKHAGATRVRVELAEHGGHVLVRVVDDGRGPGPEPGRSPDGHLGLTLLRDTVHDFGGDLEVQSVLGGGTSLIARFPVTLVPS